MSGKTTKREELLSPAEHVAALVRLGVVLEWCDSHIETYYNNYLTLNNSNQDESTESK